MFQSLRNLWTPRKRLWLPQDRVGAFRFTPGRCCNCGDCPQFVDTFDRSDSTDIGGNWHELGGDWSIASNCLTVSATNAFVRCVNGRVQDTTDVSIETTVRASTSGDLVRLYLGYVDANNNYFAEWKVGSGGYLRLFQLAGGIATQLATTTAFSTNVDQDYTFNACFRDGALAAQVGISAAASKHSLGPTGTFYGPGTGGTFAGAVHFDSFQVGISSTECERCLPCNCCEAPFHPDSAPPATQYRITVDGEEFIANYESTGIGDNTCRWVYQGADFFYELTFRGSEDRTCGRIQVQRRSGTSPGGIFQARWWIDNDDWTDCSGPNTLAFIDGVGGGWATTVDVEAV